MMIAKYLSDMWAAVAPAVGNHLWQSTLFAVVAGLLTLALRKNQARARYWIWMAASLKFLVPFSLLVGAGSHLGWWRGSGGVEAGMTLAMDEFSQPFTQPTIPVRSHVVQAVASPFASVMHVLPALLAVLWLCGLVAVLVTWFARWRGMSSAIRNSVPLRDGREVAVLRRMESAGGIRTRIRMFLSQTSMEPGIFGIARPVLVWPEGISARLDDAHVEAILAHEVGHVRRRDNLFAAIHMLVEAIFWFHPLVWFLGTRLVEEREVACDEEVLELGSERQVYAESILKICEFCVGSPLACVSGVTGADLKKRIVHIMSKRGALKLDLSKKILLGASALVAVAVPVCFGVANGAPRRARLQMQNTSIAKFEFDVVSIKPSKPDAVGSFIDLPGPGLEFDGFTARNITLMTLVRQAYGVGPGVNDGRISGGPSWLNSDKYDIEGKMSSSTVETLQRLKPNERLPALSNMLKSVLADRFKMTVHSETKDVLIYSLVIAKSGPKLQESKLDDNSRNEAQGSGGRRGRDGLSMKGRGGPVVGQAVPIPALVQLLSSLLDRTILDKTGLTGKYDFTLRWTPDENQPNPKFPNGTAGQPPVQLESDGPTLFTAIQEQLGLKLEAGKGPVEVIVIDHVEKPSGN